MSLVARAPHHTGRPLWSAALVCVGLLGALSSCATTQPRVQRVSTNDVTDLSGKWNDTDSRTTAEEMIQDCLTRPWLDKAETALGGKQPSVIVGRIRNLATERINTNLIVEDLQRALINSQKVTFVANDRERTQIRQERSDQDVNASDDTRKSFGQETGADYMLEGDINTIEDSAGNTASIVYQVNLKLMDIKTNEIAWNGQHKIKKILSLNQ